MGHAIGEVLAFGVGVALSPLAIIAVVLLLAAPGGRRNGTVFVVVWVLALAGVGTLVLLVADAADASEDGAPADWVGVVKILVGILLIAVGAGKWRGRPAGDAEPELPAWMTRLDGITPVKVAGLAVVFASVKPKNLLLTVGAALAIAETGVASGTQVVALAVFVALGTLGPGLPLAIHVIMRKRGPGILTWLRGWMVRENATIIAVLCVVMAAKLIGDALGTLTS